MSGVRLFCLLGPLLVLAAHGEEAPPPPKAYRDFALKHEGDALRGRELFLAEGKTACVRCHAVDGRGGRAGPDLFAVGDTFPRAELIDAILNPSATIAVGYGATSVETKSGESLYGIVKQATGTEIELMGLDGKVSRIATRDIKEQHGSPVSLMPENLQAALSLQEFADLIEYLGTLKQRENSLTNNRGMPDVIPQLAKPVTLRPFFSEEMRFPSTAVLKPGDVRSGLVWFGQVPGEPRSFLVVHQSGKIWLLEKKADGDVKSLFADFSAEAYSRVGPNGLLGLAFHPRFRENRLYYLKHQVLEEGKIATVVVEKRAAPDGRSDSGEPSRRLLKMVCVTQNHTGGCLAFGPDGFLYVGMGDTGPQRDPNGHGQDLQLLLGKMLRIDVDHRDPGLPYAIPADNPFRDQADARPEIWALGFREPWRFSFDRLTGDLWVGDVGQDRVEEVAMVRRGENHGWSVFEGFEPFSNQYRREGRTYTFPVAAYRRKFGNSVTGGYVYRGDPASPFYGVYIFGDYTSKRIWGLTQENRTLKTLLQIGTAPEGLSSFGTDEAGNIYAVGYTGMIYQLDFSGAVFAPAPSAPPTWERHAFALPESIWSVEAVDTNGDGRLDLIAMGATKVFALTAPDWQQHVLFDAQDGKLLYCVALDADGDGDLDLALGRYQNPKLDFEKAQAEGKEAPAAKGPDFSVAWLENIRRVGEAWPLHVIDRELNGTHGLCLGDVNRDGRPDLIADSISGPYFANSVVWFQTPALGQTTMPRQVVTKGGADGRPHYLDFADLTNDGRGEILLGDSGAGTFTWWESGASPAEPWTRHLIAQEKGATNLKVAYVNADGSPDVVATCGHGQGVFWFEGPTWIKHVIDADLPAVHALAVGDFDGDGDVDVAVNSYTTGIVRWYENNGQGVFTPHDIDTGNQQQAYDLKAVDVDGDGRIDLVLAGRESRNIVWYRNRK